jgi:hypothetical protein
MRRFGRLGLLRRGRRRILDADLFLECVPQIVGRALELRQTAAQGPAELGQLARTEHDQRDDEDDYQLGHPD